jgi:hypothetical protein
MELDYEPTVADRSVAQRKLMVEANRRPPDVVDVSRAVTAGQGGVAVTAGRRAPQWPPTAVAAPGPRPGGTSYQWPDLRRCQPVPTDTPRLLDPPRGAIAEQQLRATCSRLEFSRG